jgi:transposase InsO family protein
VAERTSELRRSERELRDVIDTIPAMVWSTLPDGTNTYDFTVPTIHLRVLFVFLVLEHQRRKVLHFGVTEHPRAEWAAQQVVEAFTERDAKPYLIRERDAIYGNEFRRRIQSLGINEIITAPRSPWQNAFAERLIGSIRRECLDHVVVLNQRHVRKMLGNYLAY